MRRGTGKLGIAVVMPDIPPSWSQAIAAVGAIIVLVLFMRFMTELMKGQGKQSSTLIDRSFDIADNVLAKMAPEVVDPGSAPVAPESSTPPPPPPEIITP